MVLSRIRGFAFGLRYIPIVLIDIYRKFISPTMFPSCRFYPSCSLYARLAFKKYGIIKGGMKSFMRLSRCYPFHPGGYDPLD